MAVLVVEAPYHAVAERSTWTVFIVLAIHEPLAGGCFSGGMRVNREGCTSWVADTMHRAHRNEPRCLPSSTYAVCCSLHAHVLVQHPQAGEESKPNTS
jgi:hypothetical protein